LKDYDVKVQPEDVVFDELTVWARILNLVYELMNLERGTPLASRLGTVDRMDVDEEGRAWGSYLRVRVTINATEPIMRCISIFSRKKNMTMLYNVMYERLPTFCISCGLLGHSSLMCLTSAERDSEGKLPYHGDKLCVPEDNKRNGAMPRGQKQSNKPSRQGTDMGPGSQSSASAGGNKYRTEASGEVNSPIKKNPISRKPNANRKREVVTTGDGARSVAISPTKPGQKCKQHKAYRPKSLPITYAGALVTVPVGWWLVLTPVAPWWPVLVGWLQLIRIRSREPQLLDQQIRRRL
jgi:hypothetical protein